METEELVLQAAHHLQSMVWWCNGVRKATRREDSLGVDILIHTIDCGTIRIQVKSSERRAIEFEEYGRTLPRLYWRIHVLVVSMESSYEVVLGRLMALCILAREEALLNNTVADDAHLCSLPNIHLSPVSADIEYI